MVLSNYAFHLAGFVRRGMPAMAVVALAAASLTLAACNSDSLGDGLRARPLASSQPAPQPPGEIGSENALAASQPGSPAASAMTSTDSTPTQGQQLAAVPRVAPVAFLPVTGAPQSVVSRLASAMRGAARDESVPVVVSVQQGAQYQVKGYFSALGDSGGTTLVYVWDVLDKNGVRVHRISGQEHGSASSGDPWNGITSGVIDRVAQSTMNSLRSWLAGGRTG